MVTTWTNTAVTISGSEEPAVLMASLQWFFSPVNICSHTNFFIPMNHSFYSKWSSYSFIFFELMVHSLLVLLQLPTWISGHRMMSALTRQIGEPMWHFCSTSSRLDLAPLLYVCGCLCVLCESEQNFTKLLIMNWVFLCGTCNMSEGWGKTPRGRVCAICRVNFQIRVRPSLGQ